MRTNTSFLIPLAVLAPAAVYAGGSGLAVLLTEPLWVGVAVSAGLHSAWILATVERHVLLSTLGWLCCLRFVWAGNAFGFLGALLLEIILLLLAIGIRPGPWWADWLASQRRTRSAVQAQLLLADGWVPWLKTCARQFLHGKSGIKEQSINRALFLAELEDARQASLVLSAAEKRGNQ